MLSFFTTWPSESGGPSGDIPERWPSRRLSPDTLGCHAWPAVQDGLSSEQRALAREVAVRQGASIELLDALDRGELLGGKRAALGDLITTDLAQRGFGDDYRPTDRPTWDESLRI